MKTTATKITALAAGLLLTAQTANAALLDFTDMSVPDESTVISSLANFMWSDDIASGGHLYLQNYIDPYTATATITFAATQDVNSIDMHGHAYSTTINYLSDWDSEYVTISAYNFDISTPLWAQQYDLTAYNDLAMADWLHIDIGVKNVDYLTFTASKKSLPSLDNLDVTPSAVPLPGAVWLLGSGVMGMVALRRKKSATPSIG
jgi:hypothetical protein